MPESTASTTAMDGLLEKIRSRRAKVGVVGLGYVGLPLAVEFARAGFQVTGIDNNASKTERIRQGTSYVGDVSDEVLESLVKSGKLRATTDFSEVQGLDTINVCVPTPLRKTKDPGYELHRVVVPGDCPLSTQRDADHSGIHDVSRGPPSNFCCRCFPNPACWWEGIFFCVFRRSGLTRAIGSTRPRTSPK